MDQQQSLAAVNVSLAGVGVSRFAQVVLPAVSGQLSELLLEVLCFPGTATLELQQVTGGQPNGTVLLRVDNLVTSTSLTRVAVEPPLTVQAGFPFAIVLGGHAGESCSASVEAGDPYARGASFIEDPRAPGEWFVTVDNLDLRFETWMTAMVQ